MTGERERILATAIQLENDGRDFYLEAAGKVSNHLARKMLESLAEDELKHIQWLKETHRAAEDAGSINKAFYQRIVGIFAQAPEEVRREAAASKDDIEPLKQAIGMEQKAEEAYEKWSGETDREEVRRLCRLLADTERFHKQALENTIRYLSEPAEWFMKEESWNFEG